MGESPPRPWGLCAGLGEYAPPPPNEARWPAAPPPPKGLRWPRSSAWSRRAKRSSSASRLRRARSASSSSCAASATAAAASSASRRAASSSSSSWAARAAASASSSLHLRARPKAAGAGRRLLGCSFAAGSRATRSSSACAATCLAACRALVVENAPLELRGDLARRAALPPRALPHRLVLVLAAVLGAPPLPVRRGLEPRELLGRELADDDRLARHAHRHLARGALGIRDRRVEALEARAAVHARASSIARREGDGVNDGVLHADEARGRCRLRHGTRTLGLAARPSLLRAVLIPKHRKTTGRANSALGS